MRTIARIQYGSKLYGTQIPTSDDDFKEVYIPSFRDILLQRCSNVNNRVSRDEDVEKFPLHIFCQYAMTATPVAVEMLFAPKSAIIHSTSEWDELVSMRDSIISDNISAFVGYCRNQARKYALKVESVNDLEIFLNEFDHPCYHKVIVATYIFEESDSNFIKTAKTFKLVDKKLKNGHVVKHLRIGPKMVPITANFKTACDIFRGLLNEYGQRAKSFVGSNEHHDWKALYHAMRIANQTIEFMQTGFITFPRPEAPYLLDIRNAKIPFEQISTELDQKLDLVESYHTQRTLKQIDAKSVEDFIIKVYSKEILI